MRKHRYVYVISSDKGTSKIGFSHAPQRRLQDLQGGSPYHLEIAYARRAEHREANLIEDLAHNLLREKRLRGEWFNASDEEAIAAVEEAFQRYGHSKISGPNKRDRKRIFLYWKKHIDGLGMVSNSGKISLLRHITMRDDVASLAQLGLR